MIYLKSDQESQEIEPFNYVGATASKLTPPTNVLSTSTPGNEIPRTDGRELQQSPSFKDDIKEISDFCARATGLITSQKAEIDGILWTVKTLQQEMASLKATVAKLQCGSISGKKNVEGTELNGTNKSDISINDAKPAGKANIKNQLSFVLEDIQRRIQQLESPGTDGRRASIDITQAPTRGKHGLGPILRDIKERLESLEAAGAGKSREMALLVTRTKASSPYLVPALHQSMEPKPRQPSQSTEAVSLSCADSIHHSEESSRGADSSSELTGHIKAKLSTEKLLLNTTSAKVVTDTNLIDRISSPSLSMASNLSDVQRIEPLIPSGSQPIIPEDDTQEYLRRMVVDDDPEDADYGSAQELPASPAWLPSSQKMPKVKEQIYLGDVDVTGKQSDPYGKRRLNTDPWTDSSEEDQETQETQKYLVKTVHEDDSEDDDYNPEDRPIKHSRTPTKREKQSPKGMLANYDQRKPLVHQAETSQNNSLHKRHIHHIGRGHDRDRRPKWTPFHNSDPAPEGCGWVDTFTNVGEPEASNQVRGQHRRRGVSGGRAWREQLKRKRSGIAPDEKESGRSSGKPILSFQQPKEKKAIPEVDGFQKQRDADGYLLRFDGKRDMRSVRAKTKRAKTVPRGAKPAHRPKGEETLHQKHRRIMAMVFPDGVVP
jgi:hypothetical protein